jgi:hypothetical protein
MADLATILASEVARVNAGRPVESKAAPARKSGTGQKPKWFCKFCQKPIWKGAAKVRYSGLRTGNPRAETWAHETCPAPARSGHTVATPPEPEVRRRRSAALTEPKQATAGILPWEFRAKT